MSKPFKDQQHNWLVDIQKEMKEAGVIGGESPKGYQKEDLTNFFKAVENIKKMCEKFHI